MSGVVVRQFSFDEMWIILILSWCSRGNIVFSLSDVWIISIVGGIVRECLRLGIVVFRELSWSLRLSVVAVRELCLIRLEKIDYFLMSFHLGRELMVIRDPLELFDFSENALLHLGGEIADFLAIDCVIEQRI